MTQSNSSDRSGAYRSGYIQKEKVLKISSSLAGGRTMGGFQRPPCVHQTQYDGHFLLILLLQLLLFVSTTPLIIEGQPVIQLELYYDSIGMNSKSVTANPIDSPFIIPFTAASGTSVSFYINSYSLSDPTNTMIQIQTMVPTASNSSLQLQWLINPSNALVYQSYTQVATLTGQISPLIFETKTISLTIIIGRDGPDSGLSYQVTSLSGTCTQPAGSTICGIGSQYEFVDCYHNVNSFPYQVPYDDCQSIYESVPPHFPQVDCNYTHCYSWITWSWSPCLPICLVAGASQSRQVECWDNTLGTLATDTDCNNALYSPGPKPSTLQSCSFCPSNPSDSTLTNLYITMNGRINTLVEGFSATTYNYTASQADTGLNVTLHATVSDIMYASVEYHGPNGDSYVWPINSFTGSYTVQISPAFGLNWYSVFVTDASGTGRSIYSISLYHDNSDNRLERISFHPNYTPPQDLTTGIYYDDENYLIEPSSNRFIGAYLYNTIPQQKVSNLAYAIYFSGYQLILPWYNSSLYANFLPRAAGAVLAFGPSWTLKLGDAFGGPPIAFEGDVTSFNYSISISNGLPLTTSTYDFSIIRSRPPFKSITVEYFDALSNPHTVPGYTEYNAHQRVYKIGVPSMSTVQIRLTAILNDRYTYVGSPFGMDIGYWINPLDSNLPLYPRDTSVIWDARYIPMSSATAATDFITFMNATSVVQVFLIARPICSAGSTTCFRMQPEFWTFEFNWLSSDMFLTGLALSHTPGNIISPHAFDCLATHTCNTFTLDYSYSFVNRIGCLSNQPCFQGVTLYLYTNAIGATMSVTYTPGAWYLPPSATLSTVSSNYSRNTFEIYLDQASIAFYSNNTLQLTVTSQDSTAQAFYTIVIKRINYDSTPMLTNLGFQPSPTAGSSTISMNNMTFNFNYPNVTNLAVHYSLLSPDVTISIRVWQQYNYQYPNFDSSSLYQQTNPTIIPLALYKGQHTMQIRCVDVFGFTTQSYFITIQVGPSPSSVYLDNLDFTPAPSSIITQPSSNITFPSCLNNADPAIQCTDITIFVDYDFGTTACTTCYFGMVIQPSSTAAVSSAQVDYYRGDTWYTNGPTLANLVPNTNTNAPVVIQIPGSLIPVTDGSGQQIWNNTLQCVLTSSDGSTTITYSIYIIRNPNPLGTTAYLESIDFFPTPTILPPNPLPTCTTCDPIYVEYDYDFTQNDFFFFVGHTSATNMQVAFTLITSTMVQQNWSTPLFTPIDPSNPSYAGAIPIVLGLGNNTLIFTCVSEDGSVTMPYNFIINIQPTVITPVIAPNCTTSTNPCQYDSQCDMVLNKRGTYVATCTCPDNFWGTHCEVGIIGCLVCSSSLSGNKTIEMLVLGAQYIRHIYVGGVSVLNSRRYRSVNSSYDPNIDVFLLNQGPVVQNLTTWDLLTFTSPALIHQQTQDYKRNDIQFQLKSGSTIKMPLSMPSSYSTRRQLLTLQTFNNINYNDHQNISLVLSSGSANNLTQIYYSPGDCAAGLFQDYAGDCHPCPEGCACQSTGECWPLPGYWSANGRSEPIQCTFNAGACPGVTSESQFSDSTALCGTGYTGIGCAACAHNYYSVGSTCYSCGSTQDQTIQLAAILFAASLVTTGLAIAVASLSPVTLVYVVTGFVLLQQISSLGASSSQQWDGKTGQIASTVFQWISVVNFDIQILRPGCSTVQALNFVTQFLATLLLISLTAVLFFTACVLRLWITRWRRKGAKRLTDDERYLMTSKALENAKVNPSEVALRSDLFIITPHEDFRRRLTHSLLILCTIFYLKLCTLQMKLFVCVYAPAPSSDLSSVDNTLHLYLEADYSTECWKSAHLYTLLLSLLIFIVYTIGFPAYTFVLLCRSFADDETTGTIGWLRKRISFLRPAVSKNEARKLAFKQMNAEEIKNEREIAAQEALAAMEAQKKKEAAAAAAVAAASSAVGQTTSPSPTSLRVNATALPSDADVIDAGEGGNPHTIVIAPSHTDDKAGELVDSRPSLIRRPVLNKQSSIIKAKLLTPAQQKKLASLYIENEHIAYFGYLFLDVRAETFAYRLNQFTINFCFAMVAVFVKDSKQQFFWLGVIFAYDALVVCWYLPFSKWYLNVRGAVVAIGLVSESIFSLGASQGLRDEYFITLCCIFGVCVILLAFRHVLFSLLSKCTGIKFTFVRKDGKVLSTAAIKRALEFQDAPKKAAPAMLTNLGPTNSAPSNPDDPEGWSDDEEEEIPVAAIEAAANANEDENEAEVLAQFVRIQEERARVAQEELAREKAKEEAELKAAEAKSIKEAEEAALKEAEAKSVQEAEAGALKAAEEERKQEEARKAQEAEEAAEQERLHAERLAADQAAADARDLEEEIQQLELERLEQERLEQERRAKEEAEAESAIQSPSAENVIASPSGTYENVVSPENRVEHPRTRKRPLKVEHSILPPSSTFPSSSVVSPTLSLISSMLVDEDASPTHLIHTAAADMRPGLSWLNAGVTPIQILGMEKHTSTLLTTLQKNKTPDQSAALSAAWSVPALAAIAEAQYLELVSLARILRAQVINLLDEEHYAAVDALEHSHNEDEIESIEIAHPLAKDVSNARITEMVAHLIEQRRPDLKVSFTDYLAQHASQLYPSIQAVDALFASSATSSVDDASNVPELGDFNSLKPLPSESATKTKDKAQQELQVQLLSIALEYFNSQLATCKADDFNTKQSYQLSVNRLTSSLKFLQQALGHPVRGAIKFKALAEIPSMNRNVQTVPTDLIVPTLPPRGPSPTYSTDTTPPQGPLLNKWQHQLENLRQGHHQREISYGGVTAAVESFAQDQGRKYQTFDHVDPFQTSASSGRRKMSLHRAHELSHHNSSSSVPGSIDIEIDHAPSPVPPMIKKQGSMSNSTHGRLSSFDPDQHPHLINSSIDLSITDHHLGERALAIAARKIRESGTNENTPRSVHAAWEQ